jgi:restriction system protein
MSYYRNYRNYRRPHYYYRRSHKSDDGFSGIIEGIFGIIAFYIILKLIPFIASVNFKSTISRIMPWVVVIGFISLFIFIFSRKRKESYDLINNKTSDNILDEKQISEINSERHGCKCYMTGLTEGEQEVADILSGGLNYKDYFIFNNLTIPATLNGSSQIDHLVVSKFGIFVIENKNYKGWIFGDKDEDNWTQSLPGGTNKFQFQNPIKQNWSHVIALQDLLPFISKESFENVIVFVFYPNLKTPLIENVVNSGELTKYIQKFTQSRLTEENIHTIIGKLSYMCQTVDISPSQHIENLKSHHNNTITREA